MHRRMPLPKEVTFVTFDVYGTLIDSDTGIYDAFSKEAEKDGYTISRSYSWKREMTSCGSSIVKPSLVASFWKASKTPFSQSMSVP